MKFRPFDERLREAADRVNRLMEYGHRTAPCRKSRHFRLAWSNAQAAWDAGPRDFLGCEGGHTDLDANEIIVEARSWREAKAIAAHLPPLPLYATEFRGRRRR